MRIAHPLAAVAWASHARIHIAAVGRLPVALEKVLSAVVHRDDLPFHLLFVKVDFGLLLFVRQYWVVSEATEVRRRIPLEACTVSRQFGGLD